MTRALPVLLFDAMDTIVKDPFYTVYPAFFKLPMSDLLKEKNPEAWPAFERGELSEEAYARQAFRDGRSYDYEGLKHELQSAYVFIEGMERILEELYDHQVSMHIMSNYPVWYRMLDETLNLSQYLPWTFVSCETGVRKPDEECYRRASAWLKRPPEECILIDDRQINCDGAAAIGMKSIHFESASSLRDTLAGMGFPLQATASQHETH